MGLSPGVSPLSGRSKSQVDELKEKVKQLSNVNKELKKLQKVQELDSL